LPSAKCQVPRVREPLRDLIPAFWRREPIGGQLGPPSLVRIWLALRSQRHRHPSGSNEGATSGRHAGLARYPMLSHPYPTVGSGHAKKPIVVPWLLSQLVAASMVPASMASSEERPNLRDATLKGRAPVVTTGRWRWLGMSSHPIAVGTGVISASIFVVSMLEPEPCCLMQPFELPPSEFLVGKA
jgi:hypothetical protein